jgi:hypothetical protein
MSDECCTSVEEHPSEQGHYSKRQEIYRIEGMLMSYQYRYDNGINQNHGIEHQNMTWFGEVIIPKEYQITGKEYD